MSIQHTSPTPAPRPSIFGAITKLWPYIWPARRRDLKVRVFAALVLLLLAKLVTIAVPYAFKWATDALAADKAHDVRLPALLAGPIALTILYGLMRVTMALLTQARDAIFADVAMNAVRRLARDVFVHLHRLSLRFHLERKTGGLTRILERGRAAIETIVRMIMLTLLPTIVEFTLILGVFFVQFDWRYAGVTLLMIVAYMAFTLSATNWRISIRRSMNESDTDANTKAIDSLLNFETVKYFTAEARETARYDASMARYEQLSVKTYTSLAVLNAGQAVIFTLGLTAVMAMSIAGIRAGTNSVGDFVLINAMMIQLYVPLNFMGMVYREIKQATIDIEMMFEILGRHPEIEDRPGAKPLALTRGHLRFEDVRFAYDPTREILRGVTFDVPPGRTVAIVGPSGAGKSTLSRLLFRFYEPTAGRITIDGQDVADVTQTSLREAIGMVPQDTVLFNDALAYNIQYGRWDASESDVRRAARDAQIDHFIATIPGRLRHAGRRARPETFGRREAARRDRPHASEGAADPRARRGDLGARYVHGTRDPGRARPHLARPHDARHRASPVDDRRGRRDPRSRQGRGRRTRHACRAARAWRHLCRHVEPAERGRACRSGSAPGCRGRRPAKRRWKPYRHRR